MNTMDKKLSSKYFMTDLQKRKLLGLASKLWSNLKDEKYIRIIESGDPKVWKNGANADPDSYSSEANVKNKIDSLIPYKGPNAADLIIKIEPIERTSSFNLDLTYGTAGVRG